MSALFRLSSYPVRLTSTDQTIMTDDGLLIANEPPPYRVEQPLGQSPFLIICDHAGSLIPQRLGTLGVAQEDLRRHIAWDIGAAGVAAKLAVMLDAFAIFQTYSRLVIDCNRPIGSPGSIVALSEHTPIPGNVNISAQDAALRAQEVFWPYHNRIRDELDARLAIDRPTVLVSMHSFTPEFKFQVRQMHAGVLYNRDARLAQRILRSLRAEPNLIVGDNEPYAVSDSTDYAIPEYGEKRGLLHVEMEIRQDLITDEIGQYEWAKRMTAVLQSSLP